MAPTGLFSFRSVSDLSKMEDEQVVAFARRGCDRATEHLLQKYRGFVEGKARSFFLTGAEAEDVVQEGMIGLYKAIRDFQSDKLARFRSFAELCVTRQIVTAIKSATRNKHGFLNEYVSLQRSCGEEDSGSCLMDVVADARVANPERIMLERCTVGALEDHARESLSDLESEALRRYLVGDTYQEIASDMQCPPKAVDNALQRAKRKMGQHLLELN